MQKPTLRPLRLVRIDNQQFKKEAVEMEAGGNSNGGMMKDSTFSTSTTAPLPQIQAEPEKTQSEAEAQRILKRTPTGYLLNQAYGLWFYISTYLLTVIITHKLSPAQYGIFAIAWTASNTINYILAFGLEDATTTFVPRILSEHGRAAAAILMRKVLLLRVIILLISSLFMLFALPFLAILIAAIPIQGSADVAAGLRDPVLLGHITPIAVAAIGSGIGNLLTALRTAQMRMRLVFVIGSLTQIFQLAGGFVVLQLGGGIDGLLWLLAVIALVNAAAFALFLAPFLFTGGTGYKQPLRPVINLGFSAWLTNLVSGALLKQVSIILLGYFLVSSTLIGYFNLSFQMGHAANLLLVSGFGGVAGSALAAAFVGKNYTRLAHSWQTIIKIETLLATPVLVFALFNAGNIALLFGANYGPVGPLLAIFLFFNILVRVLGTTIHQSTLYVVGKARLVVLGQWIGMLVVFLLGLVFIPRWGPSGALFADGIAQTVIGGLLLAFLWRDLPRKYPLGFTVRIFLGLLIAALPSVLWHPSSRFLLGVSGVLFLALFVVLMLVIRPMSAEDLAMIEGVNPRIATYLRRFTR